MSSNFWKWLEGRAERGEIGTSPFPCDNHKLPELVEELRDTLIDMCQHRAKLERLYRKNNLNSEFNELKDSIDPYIKAIYRVQEQFSPITALFEPIMKGNNETI